MTDYYAQKLSSQRLRQCYEIAPPRVRQYLEAEVWHVAERLRASDVVLDLGCGYGRVMKDLAARARLILGIDTSLPSLDMGRESLSDVYNCRLACMNGAALGLADNVFDVVLCIQNGLSAFKVDQRTLVGECLRVARSGGLVLLSTYAERFWTDRLEWFRLQAEHGLLGAIDPARTRDGVIVCKDGFTATTITPSRFRALTTGFGVQARIEEVDGSSLFCEIVVP
jgi:2-polyprenyl-6-hydroxyphenyl methylase/3-demethylubiquinone-9 3-methyltransferase